MLDLGISLFCTIFVYLSFPLIYVGWKGKVQRGKAVKLALWNSVVGCILFCIVRAILSNGEVFFTSFAPAVLYYFINKWILTNKSNQDTAQKETNILLQEDENNSDDSNIKDNLIYNESNSSHKNEDASKFNKSNNEKQWYKSKKLWIILTSILCVITISIASLIVFKPWRIKGDGSIENPYRIYDAKQLMNINNDLSVCYKLEKDIDLKNVEWTPLYDFKYDRDFRGVFDGNGHTIKNFKIKEVEYITLGLFSGIESKGVVKNLNINVNIEYDYKSNSNIIGLLCGVNLGKIENCTISGNISLSSEARYDDVFTFGSFAGQNGGSITNCTNNANINVNSNGMKLVGGIAGENISGSMSRCRNNGKISAISSQYTENGGSIGGIVGYSKESNLITCANYAEVYGEYIWTLGGLVGLNNDANVYSSYNKGNVTGKYVLNYYECYVGGIVGFQQSSSIISDVYSDGIIISSKYTGGIVGCNDNSTIRNAHWLYYSTGTATKGEYFGSSGTIKYSTFNSLHSAETVDSLNYGSISTIFKLDNKIGIIFK